MAHAIDREAIVKGPLQNLGQPAYTFNPPGFPGYNSSKYDELTKYDPKLAMDTLRGTPYEGGKNWPKITLTQREEGDGPKAVGDAIIQMLKQNLGMQIDHQIGEAKETYDRFKSVAEEATDVLEGTYATASKGVSEYGQKVIEAARQNTNAAFDFATKLINVKSLSEAVELSTAHTRKQYEAVATQTKELVAIAQKTAAETVEPVKESFGKVLKFS